MLKYVFDGGDKVPKIARTQGPEHYTHKDMNEIKDFINTKTDGNLIQGDLDATTPVYEAPHWKDKNDLDAWIEQNALITITTEAHGTITGIVATNEATRLVIHGVHKISLKEMRLGIITIEFDATGVITKIDEPDPIVNSVVKPLLKYPTQKDMFPQLEEQGTYYFLDSDGKGVIATVIEKGASSATLWAFRGFTDRIESTKYIVSSVGTTAPKYALSTLYVKAGTKDFEAVNYQQLTALDTAIKALIKAGDDKLQSQVDTLKAQIALLQKQSRNRGTFGNLKEANTKFGVAKGTSGTINDGDMVLIGDTSDPANDLLQEYFWIEASPEAADPDFKWDEGGERKADSSTFGNGSSVSTMNKAINTKADILSILGYSEKVVHKKGSSVFYPHGITPDLTLWEVDPTFRNGDTAIQRASSGNWDGQVGSHQQLLEGNFGTVYNNVYESKTSGYAPGGVGQGSGGDWRPSGHRPLTGKNIDPSGSTTNPTEITDKRNYATGQPGQWYRAKADITMLVRTGNGDS